jgi:Rod binding domain-containing protein
MTAPLHSIRPPDISTASAAGERTIDPMIKAKAEEFEGVVLGLFVKSMFAGVRDAGTMGGGNAEAQWRDLLCDEYGKALATSGGLGIATLVATQMQDMQDEADARASATATTAQAIQNGVDDNDFYA